MRKSRFTEEQMVAILRESDRTSVAEAAKKHKVSEQTIYRGGHVVLHEDKVSPASFRCSMSKVTRQRPLTYLSAVMTGEY